MARNTSTKSKNAPQEFKPYIPEKLKGYIQREVDLITENLLMIDKIPFLFGGQGTGKSALAEQLAARLGMPFFAFPVDGSIALQEAYGEKSLVGEKILDAKLEYQEKLFLKYLQMPSIICIEEINSIEPAFGFSFHQLFQEKQIYVHEAGRIYSQHEECAIICTGNMQSFAGVAPMNPALFDRVEGVQVHMLSIDEIPISGDRAEEVRSFLHKLDEILTKATAKFRISFRRVDTYNKLVTETKLKHDDIIKVAFINPVSYMESVDILDEVWGAAKQIFGMTKDSHY